MRWINKSRPPSELTAWQAKYRSIDPNYGYDLMRQDHTVTEAVLRSLLKEQGGLCAYSGMRVAIGGCHVEHLMPQSHCKVTNGLAGEDVAYTNMVACYPAPNTGRAPFGAHPKDKWPAPEQRYLFVSPLNRDCEERFSFDQSGRMRPANADDVAAAETIKQLCLNDEKKAPLLIRQRQEAIKATLKGNSLPLEEARKRLGVLEAQEQSEGNLEPYCFALKQALRKHINTVENIRASKAAAKKNKTP